MPQRHPESRIAELEADAIEALRHITSLGCALKGILAVLPAHSVLVAKRHAYDSFEELLAEANPGVPLVKNEGWYSLSALFGERAED